MKKKLIFLFFIISMISSSVEIFDEFYVLEKVTPFLLKAKSYNFNGIEMKVVRVNNNILKALGTTDDPFYFFDSNNKKVSVKLGGYIATTTSYSEIYAIEPELIEK